MRDNNLTIVFWLDCFILHVISFLRLSARVLFGNKIDIACKASSNLMISFNVLPGLYKY